MNEARDLDHRLSEAVIVLQGLLETMEDADATADDLLEHRADVRRIVEAEHARAVAEIRGAKEDHEQKENEESDHRVWQYESWDALKRWEATPNDALRVCIGVQIAKLLREAAGNPPAGDPAAIKPKNSTTVP